MYVQLEFILRITFLWKSFTNMKYAMAALRAAVSQKPARRL